MEHATWRQVVVFVETEAQGAPHRAELREEGRRQQGGGRPRLGDRQQAERRRRTLGFGARQVVAQQGCGAPQFGASRRCDQARAFAESRTSLVAQKQLVAQNGSAQIVVAPARIALNPLADAGLRASANMRRERPHPSRSELILLAIA